MGDKHTFLVPYIVRSSKIPAQASTPRPPTHDGGSTGPKDLWVMGRCFPISYSNCPRYGASAPQRYRFKSGTPPFFGRVRGTSLCTSPVPGFCFPCHRRLLIWIASNRTSYRDLLGTAESIIDMDGQMHNVEANLGDMGVRCNTRLLDKKVSNSRRWNTTAGAVGIIMNYDLGKAGQGSHVG